MVKQEGYAHNWCSSLNINKECHWEWNFANPKVPRNLYDSYWASFHFSRVL